VAALAVRCAAVPLTTGLPGQPAPSIDALSYRLKVIGIDARLSAAEVIEHQASRYLPDKQLIHESVRKQAFLPTVYNPRHLAVAI
jgi:hypothetical protein